MKSNFLEKLSQEKIPEPLESNNSFLVETSFNSDIDMNIRQEIDYKYSKSKINSEYKFPRTKARKTSHSKNPSTKSFESLANMKPVHKNSKSSFHPLINDSKLPEKSSGKQIRIILNFPASNKTGVKKTKNTARVYSSRFLKNEKFSDSKTPKKSLISIYSKHIKLNSNTVNSEVLNKNHPAINLSNKLIHGSNTLRLRRIYQNVKMTGLVNL